MRTKILIFVFFLITVSVQNIFFATGKKYDNTGVPVIDTLSLTLFWNQFQENIKLNKRKEVLEVLNYPIHAIYFVYFEYAHSCDTAKYILDENTYYEADIAQSEADTYYDFMFSNVLKEIILQTSADDLLTKGIRHKKNSGISYKFFPKNYNVQVNCPNDHNLTFHISYEKSNWSILITSI